MSSLIFFQQSDELAIRPIDASKLRRILQHCKRPWIDRCIGGSGTDHGLVTGPVAALVPFGRLDGFLLQIPNLPGYPMATLGPLPKLLTFSMKPSGSADLSVARSKNSSRLSSMS